MEATHRASTETFVRLKTQTRHGLRPGEALLFDSARIAISLCRSTRTAARFPTWAGRRIEVDCRPLRDPPVHVQTAG
jgi:hypothetical protein